MKLIRWMRLQATNLARSVKGYLIAIQEDDRSYRISRENTYHLYVFDRNSKTGLVLRHQHLNYFRGQRFFGVFHPKTNNASLKKVDIAIFVFRRNRGIFLKYLNMNNFDSLSYLIDCINPFLLNRVHQIKEKLIFEFTNGVNTVWDLSSLNYFNNL